MAFLPPASPMNFNSWMAIGLIFHYFVFKYHESWRQRYNYVLSAALDAGVASVGDLLYFTLTIGEKACPGGAAMVSTSPLAAYPTAKGIAVDAHPVCLATILLGFIGVVGKERETKFRPTSERVYKAGKWFR